METYWLQGREGQPVFDLETALGDDQ